MKNKNKWFYLIIGIIFLVFSNGRYHFALATWIAPVFILTFTRKTKPKVGYIITAIAIGCSTQISFWKFTSSNPQTPIFYLPFILGFLFTVPYLVDKIFLNSYKATVRTLVFPMTYTVIDFLYANLSPLGSMGSLAYSQSEFTSLIQIASITGIYGVTFIITWFSSIASEIICSQDLKSVIKEIVAFVAVFIVIISFGGIRLNILDSLQTVRVSGLHVYDLRSESIQNVWDNIQNDPDAFKQMSYKLLSNLLVATQREAAAGSKIVVWSEISPLMLYEDEKKFLDEMKHIAIKNNIILVASPYIISPNINGKDTNKLLIFDGSGEVILEHTKFGGSMLDNIVEGDKNLQCISTPYGKLSGVVCWDADFPNIIRQLGSLGTDVLFVPSADWKEIDPIHSAPAYFRGIENGMAVFRQTVNGLSFVSDSKGRYLAKMDHYTSSEWVMVAQLPTKNSFTLYPIIGDLFAYLNVAGLIILFALFIIRNKQLKVLKKYNVKSAYLGVFDKILN